MSCAFPPRNSIRPRSTSPNRKSKSTYSSAGTAREYDLSYEMPFYVDGGEGIGEGQQMGELRVVPAGVDGSGMGIRVGMISEGKCIKLSEHGHRRS